MKYTKKVKKVSVILASSLLCCTLAFAPVADTFGTVGSTVANAESNVKKLDTLDSMGVDSSLDEYFDESVVYKLSDAVKDEQEISVIVEMDTTTLLDSFNDRSLASNSRTVAEYARSAEGAAVKDKIYRKSMELKSRIAQADFEASFGEDYDVILSGFEVTIQAKYFDSLSGLIGDDANLIVGEVYEKSDSQVITNEVDIDESTGIFDSSSSKYDGSGTVIAVLDTGLDYTHSAFDVANFRGEEVLTTESITEKISASAAAKSTAGLTASDVYINAKVPYAYDYADKDADVYPLSNEHGTHVSGVIVGNDDTILGVAPNAQLVSMKVFSDVTEGAKTSWLLAALQDCVLLGVDVINMSLGSSCGFSNSQDDLAIEEVYNSIREAGISLVAAASNDYNSAFGSKKNGNLGLTSNPDTGTVGSPSTFSAALSVASVSGTKTPYLMFNDTVIYFTEASDQASQPKDFVNEILPDGTDSQTFEYVLVPGVGRSADYSGIDVTGKIALVKRGSTMFEDKVRVAKNQGAAGVIIYNNVSGDISMTIGRVDLPACSVSQDDGELLAAQTTGTIVISREQVAGPFMSDFSSWGPTPDLKIKPEITAHGGNILSAVPGQSYDRLSGTSMAAPNQAGVTALVRQYVKENFPSLDAEGVTARVNQLMMSTADIVYNSNGLPYSVRKQGSGLANLANATSTPAYISTFDESGNEMDKTKLELGDDPERTGVYDITFAVNNTSSQALTYNVSGIVMTEGVSKTLTVRGDRTVTQEGYLLEADVKVTGIQGGTQDGNSITLSGGSSATVQVKITLTDADKAYLNEYFENGMYVEGFIDLDATAGTEIDLSVPYLAFYGNWNEAPIFDLDYFETDPDEKNAAIDADQKTMADGYATMPVGGLYRDYIAYLGSYAYKQDPSATQIAADREHIALTNQEGEAGGVNYIYSVWAGMLRGADHIDITITDDVTGEVIYRDTQLNQRKSYYRGGDIMMSAVDFDFKLSDYDLKNNTRYTVKLDAVTAYGDGGVTTNDRNSFEFTFTTDFQAPAVTGVNFYTEYDASTKETKYYANIDIYDNHYSQAAMVGMVTNIKDDENSPYYDPDSQYTYSILSFEKYLSPLYSSFNSGYTLTYEITDHIEAIKNYSYNKNSFVVQVIDYALNEATYEITIPDYIVGLNSFTDASGNAIDSITLSPNEVYAVNLDVSPASSWSETAKFTSTDESVAGVVNGKIIARGAGTAVITATSNFDETVQTQLTVNVLSPEDEGCAKYDKPVTDSFNLTEFYIDKAYYFVSSDERDLGETGNIVKFKGNSYALSFYPSESVTIKYDLKAYFPDDTTVVFDSSNDAIVTVDENGTITAVAEGYASVSVQVMMDGKKTLHSKSISITVKNPYTTNGFYLMRYTGLGGEVRIPAELGSTEIYNYAFSGYEYVEKDENDEISEEDPSLTKPVAIGENTITKVIIPEGVEVINESAFAYLTALEEVVLPSTLKKIQARAFEGCTKLTKINLENVQFINQSAFHNCPLTEVNLSSIVAIGNSAFEMDDGCTDYDGNPVESALVALDLPSSAQSLGARAFFNNINLKKVTFRASSVKLGSYVFAYCESLESANVNASVIPSFAYLGCTSLSKVVLGKDVSVIGQYAFTGTALSTFSVDSANSTFKVGRDGTFLTSLDGTTVLYVAPNVQTFAPTASEQQVITAVGDNAFSGNSSLRSVTLPNVTEIADYAFAFCTSLSRLTLGQLEKIGEFAFYYCSSYTAMPSLSGVKEIGAYAFAISGISGTLNIADGTQIGEGAFMYCSNVTAINIGNNVEIGDGAFQAQISQTEIDLGQQEGYILSYYGFTTPGKLTAVTIGDDVTVGMGAFFGQLNLASLTFGKNTIIGNSAFYLNTSLASVDLSNVTSIGDYAFAGYMTDIIVSIEMMGMRQQYGTYGAQFIAPAFTTVDLSSVTELGAGAFNYNVALQSVTGTDKLEKIGAGAFGYCTALEQIDLKNVKEIGMSAFINCLALTQADLGKAEYIGMGAFAFDIALTTVKLADGVEIDGYAFRGAEALEAINLRSATYIGAYAFEGCTALTEANLISAEVIGDFAFASSGITSAKFGEYVAEIGENPFMNCALTDFTNDNGETTFTLGNSIIVKDGVLYTLAPNGETVLVSYPTLKEDATYTVEAGTVRISANAFAYNNNLVAVVLPYELEAIGDKAFYQCAELTVVTFKSVKAPILEEQYDTSYQKESNLPLTGYYNHLDENREEIDSQYGEGYTENFKGLGIVPFYMWNSSPTMYYYGANFVDYIGKQTNTLVFVTPANGENYDSFVISQYYAANVAGEIAPYQSTLDAIAAIAALPDYITLADEDKVIAARAVYDMIPLLEQKALVTNYDKLTSAENTIIFLKSDGESPIDPPPQEDPPEVPFDYVPVVVTLSVLAGVFALIAIAVSVLWILDRKKANKQNTAAAKDGNAD